MRGDGGNRVVQAMEQCSNYRVIQNFLHTCENKDKEPALCVGVFLRMFAGRLLYHFPLPSLVLTGTQIFLIILYMNNPLSVSAFTETTSHRTARISSMFSLENGN
jgi:hypothetical protein